MSKIYLPTQYLNKACYQVNDNYIRVWESVNLNNDNIYYDIFIKQDYQVRQGTGHIYNVIQCDSVNTYTNDNFYRLDFDRVLIIFILLAFILLYCPYRLFGKIFGKWFRL